jgi:hypothetical protein
MDKRGPMSEPNTVPSLNVDQWAKNPRETAVEAERGNFVDAGDQQAVEKELAADDPQRKGTK